MPNSPSDRAPSPLRGGPHFIDPSGGNREEMRALGYRFVDLLVDLAAEAGSRAPFDREEIPDPGPFRPSAAGRPVDELLRELEPILRHSLNPAHPGYMGHMDTLASAVGIFSDALVSAANNNMLSWEMSPVFTAMEQRVMEWITRRFGWSARSDGDRPTGHLVSGGTLANMTALLVARNARGGDPDQRGLARLDRPPVFLASVNAHFSFRKAANLLGLGRDGWIEVPADPHGAVRPGEVERALEAARRRGFAPFALVGVAGTTVTGALDPLPELAEIAAREGLWFHVDAAYGGALVISDATRPRLAGIERADSITFNPQKWLYVPKTCASILFRDAREVDAHLREAFVYGTTHRHVEGGHLNLGEWTLQGTRRVDVLKLYLTLEHLGTDRLARILERHLELGRTFAGWIREHPELELLTEPDLNIVCFRYRGVAPGGVAVDDEIDRWNAEIQRSVEASGVGWLSFPDYQGRHWLRAVILHPDADERSLGRVLEEVLRSGRDLASAHAR